MIKIKNSSVQSLTWLLFLGRADNIRIGTVPILNIPVKTSKQIKPITLKSLLLTVEKEKADDIHNQAHKPNV